jgi:hypothetical protein
MKNPHKQNFNTKDGKSFSSKSPEKIISIFFIFMLALTFFGITGCDLSGISGMEGNLTINFGSGETNQTASRSISKPPADVQAVLDYALTFTGPGGQNFIRNVPAGTASINLTVALGDWHIAAEARMPGDIFVGFGEKRFTVMAGNNQVAIPMTASETFYEIHIDPMITGGTVSAPFSAVFAGTTVTLTAAPENTAWYTIGAGDFVITGSPPISGSGYVFTFTMPAADITIGATFMDKYALGDTGPAGGKIFYINPTPADWKYMECTATAIANTNAGDGLTDVPGTHVGTPDFGEEIGRGKDNTRIILETYPVIADDLAAGKCDNYSISNGGITYDDWFLPSLDELLALAANSGLSFSGNVWSSTKQAPGNSYYVTNTGVQGVNWDGTVYYDVYAARRF